LGSAPKIKNSIGGAEHETGPKETQPAGISEEVYLKAYQDGKDARAGIRDYFRFYNTEHSHQALGYLTPAEVFNSTPLIWFG